jgi:hypothetical protein
MKAILLFLSLLASSLACAEEGEDWLPTPDGYVWPKHVQSKELSEGKVVSVATLSANKRDSLLQYWPEEQLPKNIQIREVDLNNDGKNEWFVYMSAYSGTGGSFYEILTPTKTGFRSIGSVQGGVTLSEFANGWLQIEGSSRSGGGEYTRYLLRYIDGEYKQVRNEGHDYTHNQVEIRTK